MSIPLVIFDFDGTLVDTFPCYSRHYNAVADRHRLRLLSPLEIENLRGLPTKKVLARMGLALWKAPRVMRDFRHILSDEASALGPFDGVVEALYSLKEAGTRLAICTSNDGANVQKALGSSVYELFDTVECGASLFGKARQLKRILVSLQVERDDALFIGDETRDAKAALDAGIAFGAVTWGYNTADVLLAGQPSRVFWNPADLAQIIDPVQ